MAASATSASAVAKSTIENEVQKSNATIVNDIKDSKVSKADSSSFGKNRFVHFERGDRIIYEPNEMHQLKYINEKGEVSPITGVQYILT